MTKGAISHVRNLRRGELGALDARKNRHFLHTVLHFLSSFAPLLFLNQRLRSPPERTLRKLLNMPIHKRAFAEALGTFWLVFGGCGSAVLAAGFPDVGIGLLGVSLAFGLTVLTMAVAVGPISGGHFNPAVTLGLAVAKRFSFKDLPVYWAAQVAGALIASGTLYLIASGKAGFSLDGGFASNGYGEHSPGGYSLLAAIVTEVVLTFIFLMVILGATAARATKGLAPMAIGLCLTLIHLVGIPVTNLSVNPARSTGPAVLVGDWALAQLPIFWVAPLAGAALAALVYSALFGEGESA